MKCSALLKWDNFASEMLYSKQGEQSSQIIKKQLLYDGKFQAIVKQEPLQLQK